MKEMQYIMTHKVRGRCGGNDTSTSGTGLPVREQFEPVRVDENLGTPTRRERPLSDRTFGRPPSIGIRCLFMPSAHGVVVTKEWMSKASRDAE